MRDILLWMESDFIRSRNCRSFLDRSELFLILSDIIGKRLENALHVARGDKNPADCNPLSLHRVHVHKIQYELLLGVRHGHHVGVHAFQDVIRDFDLDLLLLTLLLIFSLFLCHRFPFNAIPTIRLGRRGGIPLPVEIPQDAQRPSE